MSEIKQDNNQSEIKQENNQPTEYRELNDSELEVVCGGRRRMIIVGDAEDFIPETEAFIKSEAA